jgi:hypothetical protein
MALLVSPISIEGKMPLTQVLSQLGIGVQGGYVLFGIDLRASPEPEVELRITDPTPLGTALAQVVRQAKRYGYQPVSQHVVEVYSIQEELDPSDILNLRVSNFTATNEPAINVFSRPASFVVELKEYLLRGNTLQACGSIGPGLKSAGPGITLRLHNMPLRQILNAVAEADATLESHLTRHDTPVGWVHKTGTDEKGQIVHHWSFLSTVPHDWTRYIPHSTESKPKNTK